MKKLTLSLLATCVLASSAMASPSAFTLTEAQNNCAALKSISFKAVNPNIPHSEGTLSGTNVSGTHFTSWNINTSSKNVIEPENNTIDIQFDNRAGYGHSIGSVITCFYKYTGFTGVDVHPSMTTAHTK
jgi:hypothetical protein